MNTSSEEVPEALKEIFSRILRVPAESITLDSSTKTTRNWDSLRHVELVLEVESVYGVSFAPTEIFALTSVRGFNERLMTKMSKRS